MDQEKLLPRVLSGFRDYPPEQVRARDLMMDKIRRTFELFGFDPLDTTTVEFLEILTGKMPGWDQMGLYTLDSSIERRIDRGDEETFWLKKTGLRFDLTVSLARYVAANLDTLPRPFKRYQLGKVYRAESPQEGRYREFFQFDADTMFAPNVVADAEIIALMVETMLALDLPRSIVKVNNRKIAEGLSSLIGFEPRLLNDVLRVLDKRDKVGREEMISELRLELGEEEDGKRGLGLDEKQVETLMNFVELQGELSDKLAFCRNLFKGIEIAENGFDELERIAEYLRAMGVEPAMWEVDFSIVRGLAYYTGPVFETQLLDLPEIGSVFSGGRFDNLVSRFSSAKVPGTGASVGVDRLLAALLKLEKIKLTPTCVQCLVMALTSDLTAEMAVLGQLRRAGINAMIYTGSDMSFKAQFVRAVKFNVPYIMILGDKELADGTVTVRDLATRAQVTIARDLLVEYFRDKGMA